MICRLCRRNSDNSYNFFDTEGIKMEIASIIAKHFWFEPKSEDNTSPLICDSCWITTKKFHELYLLVEKVEESWTRDLLLIKEDPCYFLADNNENDIKEISKNKEETIIKVNDSPSFSQLNLKFETIETEDFKLPDAVIDSNFELEENVDETDSKMCEQTSNTSFKKTLKNNSVLNCIDSYKVGAYESEISNRNDNQMQNIQSIKGNRKKKELKSKFLKRNFKEDAKDSDESNEDYELNDTAKETKKKKERKTRFQKRTPEETAEYNKKVAEGDALIGNFMKIVCNFCSIEQKNFTSFKKHCTSVHDQKGWVMCCDKKFLKKIKLVEHIEKHVEPEKYKCHICGIVSGCRRSLNAHIKNKHSKKEHEKPHNCSNCGKAFRLKFVLMRHELTHMPQEERKCKCPHCDKNFADLYSLKSHVRLVHDGHYAGVCDICGKAYNNKEMLKQHRLKVHEGIDPKFKCKYCDKEFTSRFFYNIHKFREHENTNPNIDYKCPMCDKTSKTLNAIKNHIQYVHKAKAKFKCTLCIKEFKRELDLKEHMATHLGQSLYSCLYCPKTFTHNSNMIKHIKLKHPIEFEEARQNKDDKKTWIEKTSINLV